MPGIYIDIVRAKRGKTLREMVYGIVVSVKWYQSVVSGISDISGQCEREREGWRREEKKESGRRAKVGFIGTGRLGGLAFSR